MLLSNEEFLLKLQQLFEARKSSGSVFLTEKRYTYEGPVNAYPATDVEMSDARQAEEQQVTSGGDNSDQAASSYPSLIRATDGKGKDAKTKISTLVQPIDYESFSKAYGTLLKSSMTTLRKKYKKKNPTAATTASKRKPGGGNTTATAGPGTFSGSLVKVVGPRRGAGVEKRRALVRRRERQVARAKARRKQASR